MGVRLGLRPSGWPNQTLREYCEIYHILFGMLESLRYIERVL